MSCSTGGCGTSPDMGFDPNNPEAMAVQEKINNHPCYSEGAHQHYARIHVAVAPACNIQCNYCNRKYDCSNESRPGVTSSKLSPEEAVEKTITTTGRAITQTSLLLVFGLSVLMAGSFKATSDLGIMSIIVYSTALYADILLLPSAIIFFTRRGISLVKQK